MNMDFAIFLVIAIGAFAVMVLVIMDFIDRGRRDRPKIAAPAALHTTEGEQ